MVLLKIKGREANSRPLSSRSQSNEPVSLFQSHDLFDQTDAIPTDRHLLLFQIIHLQIVGAVKPGDDLGHPVHIHDVLAMNLNKIAPLWRALQQQSGNILKYKSRCVFMRPGPNEDVLVFHPDKYDLLDGQGNDFTASLHTDFVDVDLSLW